MGNMIKGVFVTPLKEIYHPKGDIFHAMKKSDLGYVDFGEAYFSTIKCGTVKAWKRHHKMTLNLVCPVGKIRFVLYDDRLDSLTYGIFQEVVLSTGDNYARLTIPPGVWMGFEGVGEQLNLLLNLADIEHDPSEQENIPILESHIAYNWNK
ncbi:MAG: dTDP-4-dehydrorhamnose 3,5-epimerase family protein [Odoribacter sp.]